MRYRIKLLVIICLLFLSAAFIFIPYVYSWMFTSRGVDFIPGPTLLSPVDDITLNGNDDLEFRWIVTDMVNTQYFDFRLYKGYSTDSSDVIFQDKFSATTYPIEVKSSLFENNQTYTWVLTQVYLNGRKSDKSFSSFKIVNP